MNAPPDQPATWYAATTAAPRQWPGLTFDIDTDLCVIGGGLAGLTVAREVARRGWSVVLIEADRIAANASGRSLGFVVPGFGQNIHRLVERCGLDRTRALWALSEQGAAYVRSAILSLAMPGVVPIKGWLDVSKNNNSHDFMPTLKLLGQDLGVDVEGWPLERVRAVLKSETYFHALHFPKAFHINPLNYALGLAADAEQRGVRLFEQTTAIAMDPVGVRKHVTTPAAKIRANHIVLAGNVQLGRLAQQLAKTILPMTTYVAVTEPIGNLKEAIAYQGAVSDSHGADYHYRVINGNRLMWSGGATTWVGSTRRHGQRIKLAIRNTYPQLRDVEIAQAWSGTAGFAVHGMPQIGEVSPGLWLANAFGGHGINTTAMAGELIARAIVEHDDTWRLFLPFDLVWAGGPLGRAVTQANYWMRRAGDAARRRGMFLRPQ